MRLAERHRLTIYDAAYLELAQRRGVPLATLDTELRNAAGAEGVILLGKNQGRDSLIPQLAYTNRGGAACTDFVS